MKLYCQRCEQEQEIFVKQRGPHKSAYCSVCERFIKHLPQMNKKFCEVCGKETAKIYTDKMKRKVCPLCYAKGVNDD